MITEETIARVKSSLQTTKSFTALEVIEKLEKENAELKEFAENIVKASADNPDEFFELIKENEKLKKEIENMRNSVKEVLLSEDCEVGQILNCVGLTWYDKGTVDNIKKENEELKKDKEYLDEINNKQTVVIIGLTEKLNKISEWVKEQEYPDGCIDCDSSATDKLKDILKQN